MWYSNFLEACRSGTPEEADYNFLHGYPTTAKISFWYEREDNDQWVHPAWCEATGNRRPFTLNIRMTEALEDDDGHCFECKDCFRERQGRARALHLDEAPEDAGSKLNAQEFSDSVYITLYNKAVFFMSPNEPENLQRRPKSSSSGCKLQILRQRGLREAIPKQTWQM